MTALQNRFCQVFGKIIFIVLLVALLGVPIVQTWRMIILLAGALALTYSDIILEKRRLILGMVVILSILVVKSSLPVAGIEEGHNIFLYLKNGEALQRSLPAAVFNDWRGEFDKAYPPEDPPYKSGTWRDVAAQGELPDRAYASSSDALWRPAKYSRKVDTISFSSLAEFRGGFANDARYYDFYGNDPISFARNYQLELPFFVMYEFSEQSVGCTLQWRGTVYWQKDAVSFERISHPNYSGKLITAGDAGKRVYALNLPAVFPGGSVNERMQSLKATRTPLLSGLAMHLELSPKLEVGFMAGNLLSLIGVIALVFFMTKIRWKPYIVAIGMTALGLIIIGVFIHYSSGKFLGPMYPPQGAGGDGFGYESLGRNIARLAMNGDFMKAFEGTEPVYWSNPGMRYARAIEKIIFGDTNLGHAAFVALLPWFVYLLIKQFAGFKWGVASCLCFIFFPLGRFSFLQYVQDAKLGYAEAIAFGLFILGFYLFMRSQPRWGGQKDGLSAFVGGMCLAGSIPFRPNLAIAVVLLGLFFLYASWRSRDFSLMVCASAGLALALFMPIHNVYFGHKFYFISSAEAAPKVAFAVSPMTYLHAGQEFLAGNWRGQYVNEVIPQVSVWLWSLPLLSHPSLKIVAELFMVVSLVTLALTVFIAFRLSLRQKAIFVFAWTALAVHMPMLFINNFSGPFRYDMLAWDMSAILAIVVIAKGLLNVRIRGRLQTEEALKHAVDRK